MDKIPNALTIFRVVLIPIYIILFYLPYQWSFIAAAGVFALASITDLFDGYLARKLEVCSKFGAFLDPVADKIMVCVALVLLVSFYNRADAIEQYTVYTATIVTFCSFVIISREIVVSALREWMAEIGSRSKVAVSNIGKWKTTMQMVAITGLIWQDNTIIFRDNWMVYLSLVLMVFATLLTIISMFSYLRVGLKYMDY
ncbi:MAG: CDP-diacylglycerol--glycerol-3-phosphate 3-phosphatidyltransferase [Succinivibrionaceae bacterium]